MESLQITAKSTIEAAILEGMLWDDFRKDHPDVKARRWKDLTYYLRKDGKLPPAVRTKTIKDLPIVIEDEREKSELKQAKALINKLKSALVEMADVSGMLKEGIEKLPQLEVPQPKLPVSHPKLRASLILPLYDLHIGHVTNGPLGTFGKDTFISRCNTLAEDLVREIRTLSKTRQIDRLVIIFGGDLIEGRTIYAGQMKESTPLQYQLTVGPEVIARNLIYPLAKEIGDIDIFCLPGNHGRIGDRNEFEKVADNLDMVFCHIVKLRCEHLPGITWHDSDNWFSCFSLYGYSYFAVHGDGFKSWGASPATSAMRYKDKIQDVINNRFDVLLAGHHHTPSDVSKGFSKICMMGNWSGTSDYAAGMALGGPPSQKLILADETAPMLAVYEFMLARKEAPIKVEPIEIITGR